MRGIADNFGYVLNGYYTIYQLDGTPAYREAVRKALGALDGKYRGFNWENLGQDGDADAIEGAMYLYNREPVPSAAAWMDYQIRWMWSKQDSAHRPGLEQFRGRGIVEGGYADGNFNRTSLMYALWKTQGTSVRPWRADVRFGAVRRGDAVAISIDADSAWSGAIRFDVPRHRDDPRAARRLAAHQLVPRVVHGRRVGTLSGARRGDGEESRRFGRRAGEGSADRAATRGADAAGRLDGARPVSRDEDRPRQPAAVASGARTPAAPALAPAHRLSTDRAAPRPCRRA